LNCVKHSADKPDPKTEQKGVLECWIIGAVKLKLHHSKTPLLLFDHNFLVTNNQITQLPNYLITQTNISTFDEAIKDEFDEEKNTCVMHWQLLSFPDGRGIFEISGRRSI
jgi:hypothetical protein